jgi:peptidoglycan-N-acetylglucosamine deacetylase
VIRLAVVTLTVLLLLAALAAGAWRLSGLRSFQLAGSLVHRVETDRRVVALTFDDGPTTAGTDSILAILARERVSATFFLTGGEMERNPELGRRIVGAGHEVGNHTYSHARMVLRSQGFIRSEIEATDALIRQAGHRGPIHFRPPYGKKLVGLPMYLRSTGRTTVMWDVEPESYPEVGASAERIVDHVAARVQPGSIILLHVMYPSREPSLRAVPDLIRRIREMGYEFVTVSELIGS